MNNYAVQEFTTPHASRWTVTADRGTLYLALMEATPVFGFTHDRHGSWPSYKWRLLGRGRFATAQAKVLVWVVDRRARHLALNKKRAAQVAAHIAAIHDRA